MKITNCTECGKVCLKSPSGLCPICQQAVHEAEEKVAEYLFDYPHSTIEQVHSSTKIARHIIMHMIRTGRIVEGAINYHCEICNALITSGESMQRMYRFIGMYRAPKRNYCRKAS